MSGTGGPLYGLRRNGEEFPAEAAISKNDTATGLIFTVTLRDIAERWERDEALRLSEERLRVSLQASPAVVFNQDQQLRYTWIQNSRLLQFSDEVVGRTDYELFSA